MMNIHHAAKSVSISAFHVTAAPTINTIKHIGDKNMVYVSASIFKCGFIIQSPMTFFPHSPNCETSFSEDTPRIPAKPWKPSFANKIQTDARIRSRYHCDTRSFGHAKDFEMRMVEHVVRLRIFVL